MAKIDISAFEIAEKFGLEFQGMVEDKARLQNGYPREFYTYSFHNVKLEYEHDYYTCSTKQEADEEAANDVLMAIGKLAAAQMMEGK